MTSLIDSLGIESTAMAGLRYPKIMLWGQEGTRKTITCLYVMKALGLRMVGIDADGGLGAYHAQDWPSWKNLPIEDPGTCIKIIRELLTDPGDYRLCVIDPMSVVWKRTQHEADAYERARKDIDQEYAIALHRGSWGPIKRLMFQLANDARRLGMSLIVTCREAVNYKNGVPAGVKPDCENALPYEFDVVVRLIQTDVEVNPQAVVLKDRWNRLPRVINGQAPDDNFFLGRALVEAYSEFFGQAAVANPRASREQVVKLLELQQHLGLDPARIFQRLREAFGVADYAELTPDQAESVKASFEKQTQNTQQSQPTT